MPDSGYFDIESGDAHALAVLTERVLDVDGLDFAHAVERNVPLYDIASLDGQLRDPARRRALMAEWAWVLKEGSGVLVLQGALPDMAVIDRVTAIFETIIAQEKAHGGGADHFAASGANDRVWNAVQKLCLADPEAFARYFGNLAIDAVCEAWLGPFYQLTAQVNLVRPGGAAQRVHRDYHLGFQTAAIAARFPAHVHDLSAVMTLQGAVAHTDMPLNSGPTQLLPFSQLFAPGYMAYRRDEFANLFAERSVQLPLGKGDALFFNPALFHAAGENRTTDIHRMANLLQISSAFGRAMESVDRSAMCKALYTVLRDLRASASLPPEAVDAAIAAAAEGYSFPTNLDTDPPESGLAPETQAALLRRGLAESMTPDAFAAALDASEARRAP
ncbi:MAG: phytanoyl-CoA dioxygenase family protein [Pseudomonadota bacterium]